MIYFRNYRIRVNFTITKGATMRDKNDEIIRGVTPVTAIVIVHNPLDMDTVVHKAANGLTRDEARRKAVFKARRAFMDKIKTKKPCVALLSTGQYRVTVTLDGGRVTGYADTPSEALHAAMQNRVEMDRIFDDIIDAHPEPVKKKGLLARFVTYIKN